MLVNIEKSEWVGNVGTRSFVGIKTWHRKRVDRVMEGLLFAIWYTGKEFKIVSINLFNCYLSSVIK